MDDFHYLKGTGICFLHQTLFFIARLCVDFFSNSRINVCKDLKREAILHPIFKVILNDSYNI